MLTTVYILEVQSDFLVESGKIVRLDQKNPNNIADAMLVPRCQFKDDKCLVSSSDEPFSFFYGCSKAMEILNKIKNCGAVDKDLRESIQLKSIKLTTSQIEMIKTKLKPAVHVGCSIG